MFTTVQRLNNISAFATSVVITLITLISITSYLIPTNLSESSLKLSNLNVKVTRSKYGYRSKEREFVNLNFDLQTDLSPLFHWNTKQIFVYLKADYSTPTHPTNSVVVWDRIIRNKKYSKINIQNGKQKYEFKEISGKFPTSSSVGNGTAIFSLWYDSMPVVGVLRTGKIVESDRVNLRGVGVGATTAKGRKVVQ